TKFGRHEVEAESRVDAFLRVAGDDRACLDLGEAVLIQAEAAAERAVAQRDVVALGPGEVLERRASRRRLHQPQVGLEPVEEQDAGLGLTAAENADDAGLRDEAVHHVGRRADSEDVEVAAGLDATAKTADRHELRRRVEGPELGDEWPRDLLDRRREMPA